MHMGCIQIAHKNNARPASVIFTRSQREPLERPIQYSATIIREDNESLDTVNILMRLVQKQSKFGHIYGGFRLNLDQINFSMIMRCIQSN